MSGGAGEVLAVGEGVEDFAVGNLAVSTFFPGWQDGDTPDGAFAGIRGEGAADFARERVVVPSIPPPGFSISLLSETADPTAAGLDILLSRAEACRFVVISPLV
jgi:NADPH:quinone reductase-like Zn-dependent oxidoreductase